MATHTVAGMTTYTVRTNGTFCIEAEFETWADVVQFTKDWCALQAEIWPPMELHGGEVVVGADGKPRWHA